MALKEKLSADMVEAMKAGDAQKRDALRMLLAAIKQSEVDGRKALDDEGVQDVLRKQIKQHQESLADYERAGRMDEVEREKAEIALIQSYLPQMMSRDEIERLASAVIADLGVVDAKGMGQVMGRLMPQVKGKADGRLVNEVVQSLLS